MADHTTPNLPARDFAETSEFFARLGFAESWRDANWMILKRGTLILEFFPHPDLDPGLSWFGCCLRLDDLDAFYAGCLAAGILEQKSGFPRLQPPRVEPWGGRIGFLLDPNGSLFRLIQNADERA